MILESELPINSDKLITLALEGIHLFRGLVETFSIRAGNRIREKAPGRFRLQGFEFRAAGSGGRILIMVIAPDGDWVSLLGESDLDVPARFGIQGCYVADPPLRKFHKVIQELDREISKNPNYLDSVFIKEDLRII